MEIVQIKLGAMNDSALPNPQLPAAAETNIDFLLEQRQVVRILQPALRRQMEETVQLHPTLNRYIWTHQGELYLLLTNIHETQRRIQIYDLIQRYQIDPEVDLEKVPDGLRTCLQGQKHRQGRFMGSVALGAMAGVLLGLIGMALSVLLAAIVGIGGGTWEMVTAVTFVVCSALGWAAAAYYLWHKYPLGFWRS